jgi:hypothetical protein
MSLEMGCETYGRSGRECLGVFNVIWGELDRAGVQRRKERLCESDFGHCDGCFPVLILFAFDVYI